MTKSSTSGSDGVGGDFWCIHTYILEYFFFNGDLESIDDDCIHHSEM